MFDSTGAVLINMLRLAAFGAAASFALEAVNGWNAARRPRRTALFAVDLIWCIITAASFFMLLLAYADGSLRLLWFICAGAGFFAFGHTVGRGVRRCFKAFFRFTAAVRRSVRVHILRPTILTAKKNVVFFSKPLIFFKRCIKITVYRLKSGKIERRIVRRKRKWLRDRKKA